MNHQGSSRVGQNVRAGTACCYLRGVDSEIHLPSDWDEQIAKLGPATALTDDTLPGGPIVLRNYVPQGADNERGESSSPADVAVMRMTEAERWKK